MIMSKRIGAVTVSLFMLSLTSGCVGHVELGRPSAPSEEAVKLDQQQSQDIGAIVQYLQKQEAAQKAASAQQKAEETIK